LDSYKKGEYQTALEEAFVEIDYMLLSKEGQEEFK
jgi:hypothetical protein